MYLAVDEESTDQDPGLFHEHAAISSRDMGRALAQFGVMFSNLERLV